MLTTPVFLYDGDCGFCTRTVRRLAALSGRADLFRPWQAVDLRASGLDPDRLIREAVWWRPGEDPAGGADAFAGLFLHLGGPWRPAGRALGLPGLRGVARGCYRLVARHRHRLGPSGVCALADRPASTRPR